MKFEWSTISMGAGTDSSAARRRLYPEPEETLPIQAAINLRATLAPTSWSKSTSEIGATKVSSRRFCRMIS